MLELIEGLVGPHHMNLVVLFRVPINPYPASFITIYSKTQHTIILASSTRARAGHPIIERGNRLFTRAGLFDSAKLGISKASIIGA
jgi:hypothetical protein